MILRACDKLDDIKSDKLDDTKNHDKHDNVNTDMINFMTNLVVSKIQHCANSQ